MTQDILLSGESKNIEYKQEILSNSFKYMKTVVAFANSDGGQLVFGVEDGIHRVVGMDAESLFQTMDAITNAVSDS